MGTLRTKKTEKKYKEFKKTNSFTEGCVLCRMKPIKSFEYWKIVNNDFPYDKIADPHHMILPKRHTKERGITKEEWREFKELKEGYLNNNYTFIFESTHKTMTVPGHFHLQLIVIK